MTNLLTDIGMSLMKVGVLGSGSMGAGIAQVAATVGHEVMIYDNNPDALKRAQDKIARILDRQVEKARMSAEEAKAIAGRIDYIDRMHDYGREVGLVIEAIIEDLDIKRAQFEHLEEIVGPDCILATNTSSLSVAAIAAACKKPGRVLGIHFFNPAPLMKLVELIPAVQTESSILEQAQNLIQGWGKTTVIAKDTPGFIVNRVARPFYGEALRIVEEGIADIPTVDWAMTKVGQFRMGPFTLMDYIGNDVNYAVTESVFRAFYNDPRYRPSFLQKRMAEAGYLGRKAGRGYYDYSEGAEHSLPTEDQELGRKIVDRIVAMLINEAADALYYNIATKEDIDLAMTTGVNYPMGLLHWADVWEAQYCVKRMDELYEEYHEDRYRCSPLLRKMARDRATFY